MPRITSVYARGAPPSSIVGRYYFSGLGNLELNMVAIMSYEMSLCFGSTQPEPATDVGQTARANMRSPIIRNIGRSFGRLDRAIQCTQL